MQTETDRKVPRSLIKHAVESCATSAPEEISVQPAVAARPLAQGDAEREVIEI
jgi:hypothetical protein